jgi:CubicO group peptidase (beta-lactamase class C family)
VTLAQLLSHTAGFKDVIVATLIDQDADETDLIREVRSWNDSVFFAEPGDVFSYSNLGFVLAGAFVADVASKPYSDVVTERVLKPLGIHDATFKPEEAVTHPFADGHTGRRGDPPRVVRPIKTDTRHWPAGFLWASALDYARIAIALMNHGMIDGRQALDPEVVAAVQQPHVRLWGRRDVSYGFGLDVSDMGSVRELSHNGRMDGYGSDIWMLPQLNQAVVLLRNRLDTSPRQTIAALRKMLLPSNTPPPNAGPAEAYATPLDELTGPYVNGDRTVIISATASGLTMTDTEGDRRGTLRPVAKDRLEFAYSSALTSDSGRAPVFVVRDSTSQIKYVATGGRAFRRQAKQ